MSSYNPVGWFEIYVADIDRAQKFYENVFQLQMTSMDDPTDQGMKMRAFKLSMEDLKGASGALVKMKGIEPGGNSTIVYFSSLDCSVEEGRVTEAGGKIHASKMPIGEHGFMSLVLDTEGNMIGIHSMQ